MTTPLVIIGGGGFGRHVHDVLDAVNAVQPTFDLLGFLDDGQPDEELLASRDARLLGRIGDLEHLPAGVQYIIGIGVGTTRTRIDKWATSIGREAVSAVHPNVSMGRNVHIEPGVVVCSHTSIGSNVRLERHVHVNFNCSVGHDATLRQSVTVYPGANISGNVVLEAESTLGTGATVIQGIRVGTRSFIGAGAAVIRDVPMEIVAVGVPARPART